jgi:RHS repeat-associated protein
VTPDGIITTVAGTGAHGFGGDGGPATAAALGSPQGVAIGPDESVYIVMQDIGGTNGSRIRKVYPWALPGFQELDILIASDDGNEVYHFSPTGLHQHTFNALTGATLYTFAYDANGRLATVTDGNGNVTTIQQDTNGNPSAIIGPYGQSTALSVDANGYLNKVADPAGDAFTIVYTPDGLLTQFTDPNNHTSTMAYDASGRLKLDTDAAGGSKTLVRTSTGQSYTVSLATASNRTTTYQVQTLAVGNQQRVTTFSDGTHAQLTIGTDGSRNTAQADGTIVNVIQGPDPRFSMQAPLSQTRTTSSGGLTSTITATRTAQLSDPTNPLSLTGQTDALTVNGRVFTRSFDAASKKFTDTSAAGEQRTAVIDAQGRLTQRQLSGLLATTFGYESHGRLASITQGTGSNARVGRFEYDANGYLHTITDPFQNTYTVQPDVAGWIKQVTLPDGRQILYGHDAKGNVTSVTPPGRPGHIITYDAVDRVAQYTPPSVPGSGSTNYKYNSDRQLSLVTRPDNSTVSLDYYGSGRLHTLTVGRGAYTATFNSTTGHLSTITAPDNGTFSPTYSGGLLTGTQWGGIITGSVDLGYDNDFRVNSLTVNSSNPITFAYDSDGLIKQAGSLTITRNDSQATSPLRNALITGISLGNESETFSYNNGFGEVTDFTAAYNTTALLNEHYVRDQLGRIAQKIETIDGVTTSFAYHYDAAGRLHQVDLNGAPTTVYEYDSNNNRMTVTRSGTVTTAGPYDNQDRMAQYGNGIYTYTVNGELQSASLNGQTTRFTYDELGNLLNVTLPNGTLIEYVIDGLNRPVGKKVGGNLIKGFLYQNFLKPIAELDGNNVVASRFVYASRPNVPDYMIKNGNIYRIITDHLGSPRLVVDVTTGHVAQRLDYDEFGRVLQDTNPGFQPFGFAGGLYDQDTKLVRFGARDYEAETGRWTTQDPIRFNGVGTNLYAYVLDDPVNFRDPLGLQAGEAARGLGVWVHWCHTPKSIAGVAGFALEKSGDEHLEKAGQVLDLGACVAGELWSCVFILLPSGPPPAPECDEPLDCGPEPICHQEYCRAPTGPNVPGELLYSPMPQENLYSGGP